MPLVALLPALAIHVVEATGYAADAGEVPLALVAVTVKVYVDPVVRPVMVQERAPVVMQV